MRSMFQATLFAALLGAATSAHSQDDDIRATAQLVSVAASPGCGVVLAGTPAIYRIVVGPKDLIGRTVTALVACIEFPMLEGGVSAFVAGDTHRLVLTRTNVCKIELPSSLRDASWFYLKAALHAAP